MPHIAMGTESVDFQVGEDLGYEYPGGLDLTPGSPLHNSILNKVMARVRVSSEKMQARHTSWRDIDRTLSAYIPLSEMERMEKKENPNVPVSIVFPHSYSLLETLTAFMDSLFLKDTIFKYEGVSPEDTVGAVLLEKVVSAHCQKFKARLALHTAFKDSIAYGIGAVFPMWKTKTGFKTITEPNGVGGYNKRSEARVLYEGNALENVDPYLLLLDPNYGVQSIQDSEFVGFVRRTNYYNLLPDDSNGSVFNIKYLASGTMTSKYFASQRDQSSQHGIEADTSVLKPVDVIYLYINIIPKEWGLGEADYPVKYLFTVAADRYIIQAEPLELDHDMFPIALCAPTFDGYSSAPLGRLELVSGMQELLDWLFNSHIANVRKTINDMIVYDPFTLNTADLIDPKPGKLVRARRAAWGTDIRSSIMQLQVNDVTRANITDAQVAMGLMNQISGADDAAMGTLRQSGPERLSAAEFNGTRSQALGRLESLAMIVGSQIIQDVGYMFAMHTQQMMTDDVWIMATGEWQSQLVSTYGSQVHGDRMRVKPSDLNIDFDVLVDPPSVDRSQVNFWIQMFDTLATQPELYQMFDLPRIFRHVATQMGAKKRG